MYSVAIIGAGASGCFCAIELKRRHPDFEVTVFEAGHRAMTKLAVTGGGRCNFTNSFEFVGKLSEAYPRGEQLIKRALRVFTHTDAVKWFEAEGIPSVVQEDACVFPKSQDAMQIVHCLEMLMRRSGVKLSCDSKVLAIRPEEKCYIVDLQNHSQQFDAVIVSTGGGALQCLEPLDLEIVKPVPSLFTFKIADESLRSLMGIVSNQAGVSLAGTPYKASGPLLITDWGLSGPAILKLSSYAARYLAENSYHGRLLVNWAGWSENQAREFLLKTSVDHAKKLVANVCPDGLNSRLWHHIMLRASLRDNILWSELGTKGQNKLVSVLCSDTYDVAGRCKFKSEFVTCGGVSLSEIDLNTLQSKRYPGLYFTGEVLDIDAITGGFNLQAAWSTAMMVARGFSEPV